MNESELLDNKFTYDGTIYTYLDNVHKWVQYILVHPKLSKCPKLRIFIPDGMLA